MRDFGDWGSDYAVGELLDNYYAVPKTTYKTSTLTLEFETEKAYLFSVLVDKMYVKVWLPKRYVVILSTSGKNITIRIPDWLTGKRAKRFLNGSI